jgi:hypothetical protein
MSFEPNDYFKKIAISHVDIAHTDDKPAYFREFSSVKILFNNSDFLDKMRYAKRFALVSQFNKDGNYSGPNSDSLFRNYTGAIYLISRIIDKTIDQAFTDTNRVLDDIIAKIGNDMDTEQIPFTFRLNEISVHSLGEIADGYYGLVAFLSYIEPSCNVFDAAKWE